MGILLTQGLVIGGPVEPEYPASAGLSVDQTAGGINITVTCTGNYFIQWGDGEYSSPVASGVESTHTYSADFDGTLYIRAEGPITGISSTSGGWDFNVTALPSTLTSLTVTSADAALTGLIEDLPEALTYLDISGTSSAITGEFPQISSTLQHLDISDTSCEFIAFIENFPSTLQHFDVSGTTVTLFGDIGAAPTPLNYIDINATGSSITAASQETTMASGVKFIDLSDTNLSSDTVDNIIIAMSGIASWGSPKTLDIGGNNAPRTTASDAAMTTLSGLGVTVTVNETAAAASEITVVDTTSAYVDGNTSITVTKPTGTDDGDTMIALCYLDEQDTTGVWSAPAGWSQVLDHTSSTGRQRHITVFKKVASSEGADYTFTHNGAAAQIGAGIISFDSVNATTLDVTYSEGSHLLEDGAESFTCPAITTSTDGAMVLMMQAITHNQCTAGGAPAGYTLQLEQIGDQDGQILFATRKMDTAGTSNPGDWTSTFSATNGVATTVALALKPADAGTAPITEPVVATLANNQSAGLVDITITTHDASPYKVNWGDGTISGAIASGATASYSYATAYDGDVIIRSDGNVTAISSGNGGWDFALSALPSTCTSLNLGGTDAAVTGALSDLPTGLTDLQLFDTSSVVTGDFGDEPSGMVTLYLSNTSSNIGGASANMASTFVNLSLRGTNSDAAIDLSDIPSGMRLLRLHDSSCTIDASAGTIIPTAFEVAELHNLSLTATQVDQVLQTFSTIETWAAPARIDVDGTNADRTSASDSAVTTLEGNEVTVNVNEADATPTTRVGIVFTSSVENGVIYPDSSADDGWRDAELHDTEPYRSQCFQVLSAADTDGITPREGTYCMRFYWERYWPKWGGANPNKTRAELKRGGNLIWGNGDELWMGFSIYLPDDTATRNWVNNTNTNQSVTQMHDLEGSGTSQLMARSGRWEFAFGPLGKQFCGNVQFGVWTDFVLNARVSNSGTGFAKLWVNADSDADSPIYNRTGATLRSGVTQLYHKIGVYNQDFDNQAANIAYIKQYHDAYRIGNATSNFASVKPG